MKPVNIKLGDIIECYYHNTTGSYIITPNCYYGEVFQIKSNNNSTIILIGDNKRHSQSWVTVYWYHSIYNPLIRLIRMSKSLPTLYKYTSKGQIQQWKISYGKASYHTEEGIQGGKLTTSEPTYCYPKNIGKANETTAEQQTEKEAKAKWDKKVASGYNEVLTTEKKFLEPMLAFEYSKYPIDWDNLMDTIYVQPKLDGVRCINENNTLMSRNGKPLVSTPHLHQNDLTLDGELYTHEYKDNFNEIISLVRKSKPSPIELAESSKKIQYWIYDTPEPSLGYGLRMSKIGKWYNKLSAKDKKKFILVPTFTVTSEDELKEKHAEFIGQGYEGTIVRVSGCGYEFKRSKSLLKYKDFIDEEFIITGYEEGSGNRAGSLGAFILTDKDEKISFRSNVKGTHEYLKEIWKDRDSYMGATATVKYFQRTPDNIPRFPYIIKLKREEYE